MVGLRKTGEIVATLTNTQTGAFIKGANVAIKVNSVKNTIKTDKNGQVKLSIEDLDAIYALLILHTR